MSKFLEALQYNMPSLTALAALSRSAVQHALYVLFLLFTGAKFCGIFSEKNDTTLSQDMLMLYEKA